MSKRKDLDGDLTPVQVYLRLLTYVKSQWWLFVLSFIGYAIYSSSQAGWPEIIGLVVEDNPDIPFGLEKYLALPAAVLLMFFVRGFGSFLGQYTISIVAQKLVHALRLEVFKKVLSLPASYFTSTSSGHLLSKITYNTTQVVGAATEAITVLLREGMTVIALLGYMIYLSWELTLIFMTSMPFIALAVGYASKRFRLLSKRIQNSMGDITQSASESVQGFQEIRIFGGEEYEYDRFNGASTYSARQGIKLALVRAINTPAVQMLIAIPMAILVYIGLNPEYLTEIDEALFIQYITAAGLVAKPIRTLTNVNSKMQKGIAAAGTLFELLDTQIEKDHGDKTIEHVQGGLSLQNVNFAYEKGKQVLNDFSLDIHAGEMVAIVGHSGSGKSTLASLLPRFNEPQSGQILLDGVSIQELDLKFLREQIALVSQNVFLFQGTLKDNIAYGELSGATDEEILKAAGSAYVMEFAKDLEHGLDTTIGERGLMLSGGQRQRLAIARAILKDAPILILDEATSALDNASERFIQSAMSEVMKGRTTIVIAHRLSTIVGADRIVVMASGEIEEVGTHDELLAKDGIYAQLYHSQFEE
ncbi:lipid A export permease/ATP-binding protein MsbA [Litoribrevibacter albus]|uniref:Lipid A export ATP-binding/permease protein MsbA n=1 Tax=Litoribrevibacter albus TaxID=1473156 RepID=A0AA37SCZ3_9GAMM|nr:lipid A export permease/ATP-binding protein MsbA [Litoribrevibacter albus]GLQ32510.1 lipid A export ATP-binding/permease protein MsbA [Litoribrevibacter albus]